MKKIVVALMAFCVAGSVAFAEGMYWQSKSEGGLGERTTENFAMPKKFKVIHSGSEKHASIFIARLDKQLFWTLDPEKKTYTEMTFADMEQMMTKATAKMDEAMAKMREKMKDMPEEQRKMMEKMMPAGMSGAAEAKPMEVKNTGEKKTISGYACTKYVVMSDGEEMSTMWVTKDVKPFASLMNDWKEFAKRMSSMTARFSKNFADAYKNIDGFPIQTSMRMMNNEITTTVTKIEARSTAASEFDIPADYTKTEASWKKELAK